jgi:hypothetical protein
MLSKDDLRRISEQLKKEREVVVPDDVKTFKEKGLGGAGFCIAHYAREYELALLYAENRVEEALEALEEYEHYKKMEETRCSSS